MSGEGRVRSTLYGLAYLVGRFHPHLPFRLIIWTNNTWGYDGIGAGVEAREAKKEARHG